MDIKCLYTLKDSLFPLFVIFKFVICYYLCFIFIAALEIDQSYYTRAVTGMFPAVFPFLPPMLAQKQIQPGDFLSLLQKMFVY